VLPVLLKPHGGGGQSSQPSFKRCSTCRQPKKTCSCFVVPLQLRKLSEAQIEELVIKFKELPRTAAGNIKSSKDLLMQFGLSSHIRLARVLKVYLDRDQPHGGQGLTAGQAPDNSKDKVVSKAVAPIPLPTQDTDRGSAQQQAHDVAVFYGGSQALEQLRTLLQKLAEAEQRQQSDFAATAVGVSGVKEWHELTAEEEGERITSTAAANQAAAVANHEINLAIMQARMEERVAKAAYLEAKVKREAAAADNEADVASKALEEALASGDKARIAKASQILADAQAKKEAHAAKALEFSNQAKPEPSESTKQDDMEYDPFKPLYESSEDSDTESDSDPGEEFVSVDGTGMSETETETDDDWASDDSGNGTSVEDEDKDAFVPFNASTAQDGCDSEEDAEIDYGDESD
jgi:hypothetical protein